MHLPRTSCTAEEPDVTPKTVLTLETAPSTLRGCLRRLWSPLDVAVTLNAPEDTAWAHRGFEHTLHIVTAAWSGLRAAAAYAPGHKLVVRGERPLSTAQLRTVTDACASLGVRTAVVHGYSPALASLAGALRAEGVRCLGVWHGASSQFYIESERAAFVAFTNERAFAKIAAVKPGLWLACSALERDPFMNFIPTTKTLATTRHLRNAALVPVPSNWIKNFHSNVLAAVAEPRLRSIWITTPAQNHFPPDAVARLKTAVSPTRDQLFALMREVDVVLNASLTECQPMAALEALAHGVPCLAPAVGIEAFDDHPYAELVNVAGASSLLELRAKIGRVLDMVEGAPRELDGMLRDFGERWQRAAVSRFQQLTES